MTISESGRYLANLRWHGRAVALARHAGRPIRLRLRSGGRQVGKVEAVEFGPRGLRSFFRAVEQMPKRVRR